MSREDQDTGFRMSYHLNKGDHRKNLSIHDKVIEKEGIPKARPLPRLWLMLQKYP
jgi:hypothetical protein